MKGSTSYVASTQYLLLTSQRPGTAALALAGSNIGLCAAARPSRSASGRSKKRNSLNYKPIKVSLPDITRSGTTCGKQRVFSETELLEKHLLRINTGHNVSGGRNMYRVFATIG